MKLYNSLSSKLEDFFPLKDKKVTLYVCGITPYDTTHLGHAFTYLSFDVLVRFLTYLGYEVKYTQNVTDINDRDNDILKRALQQNIPWQDLANFWTKKFLSDMKALNWIKPTHYINASENIDSMIILIQKLLTNNLAYQKNNSVYLDVSKIEDYGKLSKLSQKQMLKIAQDSEEGVDNPDKRSSLDITLWRASTADQPKHIPSFPSPWGKGRPGWHIECSAMAISTLDKQIDIHGGGRDLIFPHHSAEIAQSEGATGKEPFVKYWMHTGEVSFNGKKMSKTLGNLVLVSDLLKKYSANTIRWALLSHHYRKPWELKENELKMAEKIIKSLKLTNKNQIPQEFIKALDNDLDTPKALEIIRSTGNIKAFKMLGFK